MKAIKILLGLLAVVVIVVGGVAIYVSTLDFNSYKGEIREAVKEATGRDLEIAGDLELELSFTPRLRVKGVRFQNAAWGSKPDMVSIGELDVVVALLPLLSENIEIRRVVLNDVEALLETDKAGTGNWDIAGDQRSSVADKDRSGGEMDHAAPSVGEILLSNIVLTYRDGRAGTENRFTLETITLNQAASGGLDARIKADIDGEIVDVEGALPPLASLMRPGSALPIALTGQVFGFDLDVAATVTVRQGAKGPEQVEITDLEATVQGSDLAGSATVAIGGAKPAIMARVSGTMLDLPALRAVAGDSGVTSTSGGGDDGGDPLDRPLPLDGLRAVNADIDLSLQTLKMTDKLSVTDVQLAVTLKDGLLRVKPSTAVLGGGKVDLTGTIDSRDPVAKITIDQVWVGGDFGALAKVFQDNDLLEAKGDTSAKLTGSGRTPREILASLNGHTAMIVREGRIDNAYWELIAADAATQFLPFLDQSKRGVLNCMVSRFNIKNGLATSAAMLVDTDRVAVAGQGEIKLSQQELDLKMTPEPKNPSLISLAFPILISGPASDPVVIPDPLAVAKGVGAIAVAGVNPLTLALPFLSAGNADEPCPAAIAIAEGKPVPKSAAAPKSTGIGGAADAVGKAVSDPVKGLFDSLKKAVE